MSTSFRSFYVLTSESFKVQHDAVHLALSFGMNAEPIGGGDSAYTAFGYKVADLNDLPCFLKSEWNSSIRELYSSCRLLAESATDG